MRINYANLQWDASIDGHECLSELIRPPLMVRHSTETRFPSPFPPPNFRFMIARNISLLQNLPNMIHFIAWAFLLASLSLVEAQQRYPNITLDWGIYTSEPYKNDKDVSTHNDSWRTCAYP